MAQYQTMAREWAQYTKQMKKQQWKGPLHSDEVTLLSSRQNEIQSSSTKGRNKKFKGEAESDEASTPHIERSKRRHEISQENRDHKRDLEQLMKEFQELKNVRKDSNVDQEVDDNPLSLEIQFAVIPPSYRVPKEKYNGMTDPIDHVACFESTLDLYGTSDAIKCKMFPTTLIRMA